MCLFVRPRIALQSFNAWHKVKVFSRAWAKCFREDQRRPMRTSVKSFGGQTNDERAFRNTTMIAVVVVVVVVVVVLLLLLLLLLLSLLLLLLLLLLWWWWWWWDSGPMDLNKATGSTWHLCSLPQISWRRWSKLMCSEIVIGQAWNRSPRGTTKKHLRDSLCFWMINVALD